MTHDRTILFLVGAAAILYVIAYSFLIVGQISIHNSGCETEPKIIPMMAGKIPTLMTIYVCKKENQEKRGTNE